MVVPLLLDAEPLPSERSRRRTGRLSPRHAMPARCRRLQCVQASILEAAPTTGMEPHHGRGRVPPMRRPWGRAQRYHEACQPRDRRSMAGYCTPSRARSTGLAGSSPATHLRFACQHGDILSADSRREIFDDSGHAKYQLKRRNGLAACGSAGRLSVAPVKRSALCLHDPKILHEQSLLARAEAHWFGPEHVDRLLARYPV